MKLYLAKNLKRFPSKARVLALLKNPQCFLALFLIVFLCGNAILNWNCISQTWKSFAKNKNITTVPAKLEAFPKTYNKTITDKFYFKDEFINLDGLAARIAQRRLLNNTFRIGGSGLVFNFYSFPEQKTMEHANKLIDLKKLLDTCNIPFIHCQAPRKPNCKNAKLPKGIKNKIKECTKSFLNELQKNDVPFIDFTPFSQNIDGFFFKTDHHWQPWSALLATKILVDKIKTTYPQINLQINEINLTEWDTKIYEKWFLGSNGKRVGVYFKGVDDFPLVYPKFKTDISCIVPHKRLVRTGTFLDANIDFNLLEKRDLFHLNPYCSYLGGTFPQTICVNHRAKNNLKIMMLTDSFGLPVQAFLSTIFKEVYAIDPRYFKNAEIGRIAKEYKPDIFVSILFTSDLTRSEFFNFSTIVKNQLAAGVDILDPKFNKSCIYIGNKNNKYECKILPAKFISNQSYELNIKSVKILKGNPKGIMVAVWDRKARKFLREWIFPTKSLKNSLRWSFSIPSTSDPNDCVLAIYAGIHGDCSGNLIKCENISLTTID